MKCTRLFAALPLHFFLSAISVVILFAYPTTTEAIGEASNKFQIYVPPNGVGSRAVALIVTAQLDNTTVDIVDDDADGDNDDTYTNITLDRGESYVVFMKDGVINDDARGKWDGDYFIISSDLPVTVQMATDSDWQHDWVPANNKSMMGQSFYIYSPTNDFSERDVNVFGYFDNTEVAIYDITDTEQFETGKATVDIANRTKILGAQLSQGEDLIVRNNLGIDLLDPGRSYLIETTQPVTVQYGSLYDERRTSAREGGSFVPAKNGSSAGETFYFFAPHNPNKKNEIEIRVISYDNNNNAVLEGWDVDNEMWVVVGNWQMDAEDHEDYVGGEYNLFRITTSLNKKVSVFEGNWLETGTIGTSDAASFMSAKNGYGAGTNFLTYVLPPIVQSNIPNQKGKYTHAFIYANEDNTSISINDVDTGGSLFSTSTTMQGGEYLDVRIDDATWNSMADTAASTRPYIQIQSDKNIAAMITNWNDNWMTYATSVLVPNPQTAITASSHEGNIGDTIAFTMQFENIGNTHLLSSEAIVTIPDGLTYVDTTGSLGSGPSVSTSKGVTTLTFSGYSFQSGLVINQVVNTTIDPTYDSGEDVRNSDILSVQVLVNGTSNGEGYATADSAGVKALDPTGTDVESLSAIKQLDTVLIGWETSFENNNAGFNLYRSDSADGKYRKVNSSLILSKGDAVAGNVYTYTNTGLNFNKDYFYMLEVVPQTGDSWEFGPVSSKDSVTPDISLLYPNGGRVFIGNEYTYVTWGSLGLDGTTVKIEYSTDDFASDINVITNSTANDGKYRWQVPNTPTTTLKVRVTSNQNNSILDISDEYSIIQPPEYSDPAMEVYATTLEPINTGATKYFPFGIADYSSTTCAYNLTADVDADGWTNTIYYDENANGILDATETTVVSATTPLSGSTDEYHVIVKSDLAPTLDEDNPTVDSWDYKLTLNANCPSSAIKSDTGFYHKYEAEFMGSDGRIVSDPDASNSTAVKGSKPSVLHHLTYGGYFTEYVGNDKFQAVVFRAKTNDNDYTIPVGELDIVDFSLGNKLNTTVNEFVFPANQFFDVNTYQGIYLYMISPLSGVLEPRVDFYGVTDIWVDTVEIRSLRKGSNITYEGEFMEKFTGTVVNDPDSSGGQHISATAGETGHMAFGPYTTLPNDPDVIYAADFYLKVDDNSVQNLVGKVEVNNYLGDGIVAEADIYASQFAEDDAWQVFTLTWRGRPLDTAGSGFIGSSMEYRVWSYGDASSTLSFDKVVQHRTINQSPVYEAEQYYRTVGANVADKDASNGTAVTTDQSGFLMFGPNSTDEVGQTDTVYQAIFRMKVDDNSITRPAAYLDVFNSSGSGGSRLAGFPIYPSQFQYDDTYQNFVLQFNSPLQGDLQYRVQSYGVTDLTLDKIELRTVGDSSTVDASEANELYKYEDTDFSSDVGTYVYDAVAADQLAVRGANDGYLTYGPNTTDGIGATTTHKARFGLKSTSNTRNAPIARLEVHAVESDTVIADKLVFGNQFIAPNEYQNFFVPFTPPSSGTLQYRTYLFGTGETVSLDRVKVFDDDTASTTEIIRDAAGNTLAFNYTANDFNHFESYEHYDQNSVSGTVLRSDIGDPHFTAYGPFTLDGVGTNEIYQAKFALSTSDNSSDDPIARLEVFNAGDILSSVEIFGTQFNEIDTYQEFLLNFSSPLDGRLEYRVYTYGTTVISLDYVDVYTVLADITGQNDYDFRYEAEGDLATRNGIGVYDKNASRLQALRGKTEGHLSFGPYTEELSGNNATYRASFNMRTNNKNGNGVVARLDVSVDGVAQYQRLVFASEFKDTENYFNFPIIFESPDAGSEVQLRTYIYGDRTMWLDRVDVVDLSSASTTTGAELFEYQAESDLVLDSSYGSIVPDPSADGSSAVRTSGDGQVLTGPATSAGVGTGEDYEAQFYLKVPENTSTEQAVTIDVYDGSSVLASKIVYPAEFGGVDAYQFFPLQFSSPNSGALSYRVEAHGNTPVTVDRVEVIEVVTANSTIGDGDYNYEAEHQPTILGTPVLDTDAGNGAAVQTATGTAGHVSFGPYTTDMIGSGETYKAKFFIKVADNSMQDDAVVIDVTNGFTELSKLVLSGTDFNNSNDYQSFSIIFDAPSSGDLQFRIFSTGETTVTADRIEVSMIGAGESLDSGDQLWRYTSNDVLPFLGTLTYDTSALGSQTIKAPAGNQGVIFFGPYTNEGINTGAEYEARFKMKIDDNSGTNAAVRIDAYANGSVLDELIVFPGQFATNDTFQDFSLTFDSPATGTLEYRMYSYGSTKNVDLDRIDIFPYSGTSENDGVNYLYEAESLYQVVGSPIYESGSNGNRAVRATAGTPGHFAFGPYTSDAVGSSKEYIAKFYVKTDDNTVNSNVLNIDVTNGFNKLAELSIRGTDFDESGEYQVFTLLYDAPSSGTLQYRAYTYGNATVYYDKVEIIEVTGTDADTGDFLYRYNASADMGVFFGDVVYDTDAVSLQAVRTQGGTNGTVLYGPYTTDGIGTTTPLEARFRMKIDEHDSGNNDAIAKVDIYNSGTVLAERFMYADDFAATDAYEEFAVPFTSPSSGNLEYRMFSLGESEEITIDRIDIYVGSATSSGPSYDFQYEVENLYQIVGSKIFASGQSNSRVVKANQGQIGHLAFGPYTAEGINTGKDYDAVFSLRAAAGTATGTKLITIDVAEGNNVLGYLEINAEDFSTLGDYEDFTVPFSSPSGGTLQYRIFTHGVSDVYADVVTITEQ